MLGGNEPVTTQAPVANVMGDMMDLFGGNAPV